MAHPETVAQHNARRAMAEIRLKRVQQRLADAERACIQRRAEVERAQQRLDAIALVCADPDWFERDPPEHT